MEVTKKAESQATKKIKIMVLDDEKDILNAFSRLMRQSNVTAEFYSKGSDAIRAFRAHPDEFKLVMTDIRMPEIDGIAFVETLREIRNDIPIIFMTGYTADDVRDKAMAFDKVVFLEKPFHLAKVIETTIPALIGENINENSE